MSTSGFLKTETARPSEPTKRPGWRFGMTILIFMVVIAEGAILLHFCGLGAAPLDVDDYKVFDRLAQNLLDYRVFSPEVGPPYGRTYFRTPGYPAYIAVVYAVCGRSVMALRVSQFLLLGITGLLLQRLARRFLEEWPASLAALLCVTYPPLVSLAPLYTMESLTNPIVLVVILILAGLGDRADPPSTRCVALGLLLGVLTLIRPAFTLFPFACVVALVLGRSALSRRRRLLAGGLVLLGYALVLTPWIARNSLLVGKPVGPSSGGAWGLLVSARQYNGDLSYGLLESEWVDTIAEFNQHYAEAERIVKNDPAAKDPEHARLTKIETVLNEGLLRDASRKFRELSVGQILTSLPSRLYWLWSTADFSPWAARPFHRILQLWHLITVALALVGVWGLRKHLVGHWLLWITPVYLTALHLVFHVEARYTVPARPFLLVYTAWGLGWLIGLTRRTTPADPAR